MQNKFHGVVSLLLLFLAIFVALRSLSNHSLWLALLYLVMVGLSSCGILYAYCTKCSARLDNCSHLYPGKLTRLLPQREQGPYAFWDVAGTALLLGLIILFPQYWLIKQAAGLILFWALVIVAVADILVFVCPRCNNKACLMCPSRLTIEGRN